MNEKFNGDICFPNKEIREEVFDSFSKTGGLFLSDDRDLIFPYWEIATCNHTGRVMFTVNKYFKFFEETIKKRKDIKIESAITVMSAYAKPIEDENQIDFFSEVLKRKGRVGFAIHGTIESINVVYNAYLMILEKAKKKSKINDDSMLSFIPLTHVKSSLNAGYLVVNTNEEPITLGADAIVDKENKPKIAISKPCKRIEEEKDNLIAQILEVFMDQNFENVKNGIIRNGDLTEYCDKTNIDHISWLVKSQFITIEDIEEAVNLNRKRIGF